MKEYLITVNGKSYEVQVEELGETSAPVQTAAPKAVPAAKPAPKPAATQKATSSSAAGKIAIKCPMPGTIVKVGVAVGDTVKNGTVLCVLEAMKMENDISAPQDGVIVSVNTSKGATVNSGDILFTMS